MLALVPQILRLHEFRKFEDKPNVINLTAQTIDVGLTQMLSKYCDFDETLVVGSIAYKDLIGKLLVCICV
jgi:branched-subunit amino acid transport protein AzlD